MEQTPSLGYKDDMLSFEGFRNTILEDYRIAVVSREVSLLGRREVLTGKAKFGIFGDGKEVAQLAMAKYFQPGDFRSGYYRDQTFIFASGLSNVEQYFAQLYADPDVKNDPFSAGRQMNAHFATKFVDDNGNWLDLANRKNISSDMAPTASQMPRALGLAWASKCFRSAKHADVFDSLSHNGNEICFCTIGDASTSEGHFWETLNAAGVLQIPLAVFVWDDGYGISVPKNFQTTKGSISEAVKGLEKEDTTNGIRIYKVKAWDYAGMCEVFEEALQRVRETHVPVLFHVEEVTQPQGHSTSGSHERYKSQERLDWEKEWDCIKKMKEWLIETGLSTAEELTEIEAGAKEHVREGKNKAWEKYQAPIKETAAQAVELIRGLVVNDMEKYNFLQKLANDLQSNREPLRRDIFRAVSLAMETAPNSPTIEEIRNFYKEQHALGRKLYNSDLYNEGPKSALRVEEVKPMIAFDAPMANGYEVLNKYFDQLFAQNPYVYAFGEDVGHIGDVNQGFAGLQDKHGKDRISDTGIRELTIVGQAIGLSLRGLRPIAEIQYLDYLLYGLQPLSDDVSTTHFRTKGQQSVPIIIRTRGHRLEGIWHSGSPMGMIINAVRGMYVCVPRNMVQAAGMYNTLLRANDPAIVVECLNGYRLKEKVPANLLEFTVPLGIPEILREGTDITIVSYGSTLRIVEDAVERLQKMDISCEVIDVQTLLPFDINHKIIESLKKTNRILFVDEDVPGGAAAYMFSKVMEEQKAFQWLDVSPRTLTAQAHRPGYGSDGDYFSKPNAEDVVNVVVEMVKE
ncbi:transketolase [Sediminibacterium roseum]|uniref:3-methyl-2-oxobutanoate dehydrogenase (2-methylpropanoyl-transferring) n=1 Tax=Sediminibacterium roseum TaxID=1978412 RepID=A0ABW9ZZM5_9BACT|nr:alpha-ketoacid dehydrogenase subunit alpha/beta [Sediminibacterium roseum]NCI51493.1 transketolase [Sediminibacterium roseum]